MQGKEIADSGLQLERIVRLVARKGSIVEVTGYSTGVFNIPYPLLLPILDMHVTFVLDLVTELGILENS